MSALTSKITESPENKAPEYAGLPSLREHRSSRRWIRKRMDMLDPVRDYAEIVGLSNLFRTNTLMGEWVFAVTITRFTVGPSGRAIARDGKGKLLVQPVRRAEDTSSHFLVWAEYGPESPQARKSVDMINQLHAHWQKKYPKEFADPDLWMYVIAWDVFGPISLFVSLGLPEPSEKEKIALNIFARKITELFIYVDGRPFSQVHPVPDGYEEWVDYIRRYEARPWSHDRGTEQCLASVLENFEKLFPRPLRAFGRALATSFWHEQMFKCGNVQPPGRIMRWAARAFMKAMLVVGNLLPDPKESLPEKLRREAAKTGKPLSPALRVTLTSCPMGFGGAKTSAPGPEDQ